LTERLTSTSSLIDERRRGRSVRMIDKEEYAISARLEVKRE